LNNQHRTSTTVAKAFAILDVLASNGDGGTSLKEVSNLLGMSKSTAHRYLTTLEKLAVVERNEKDHFRLGLKLIKLAGAFLSDHNLRNVSEPSLNEVAAQTQETIHLAVPSINEVVYIAKVDSPHSIRMASRIGARMPMYCTSLGKAILAHYPFNRVEEIIHEGTPARTPYTITSAQALRAELERVHAQGFATDDQENEIGVRCVGAPIFDYTTKVIGAISVSGPANRMSKEWSLELGPLVRDAALEVSRRMGYPR
jgi:IclR family acetate operon transcriptional repressor